jgi:hypothetical protein
VDRKQSHVEGDWNDYKAEEAGEEVLEPQTGCDIASVSKQNPELHQRQAANPGNCEQTNPFHADCCAKANTGGSEPEPPRWLKSFCGALLVLVCKACPGKRSDGRENDERGVEENKTRLGDESIV